VSRRVLVAEPCWAQVCLAVFGFGHRRPIPDPTPFAEEQPNRWVRGGSPPIGTLLRISPILRHSASGVRIVASLDRTRLGAASVRKRKCAQRRKAPLGLIKAVFDRVENMHRCGEDFVYRLSKAHMWPCTAAVGRVVFPSWLYFAERKPASFALSTKD
jgi:hypothetical protein